MRIRGLYRLRINGKNGEHCYVKYWGGDRPATQCGEASRAAQFSRSLAEDYGQKWHDWLIANDHADAAKRVEIVPAGGGVATG